MHRWMLFSRIMEAECCRRNPRWFPAQGEEAILVGAFFGLRPDDLAAPHYRGPFVIYAMRGADPRRLAAQALGKATGYSLGRSVPFTGPADLNVVPWVAGDLGTSIGVAAGAALSIAYRGGAQVVVLSVGDGTTNRGDFHESLNLAAVWKLPLVVVVQNNQYSISLHLSSVTAAPIVDRAAGYGIPGMAVDGTDVLAVHEVVAAAVARARRGDGPSLIEARAYRWGGHWAADRALYRPAAEVDEWTRRDPITLLETRLLDQGVLSQAEIERVRRTVEAEVAAAFSQAEQDPPAGWEQLGIGEVFA
jgi:TPP-dependent pyruvate/acetoin dehydrogenase alpha subunit